MEPDAFENGLEAYQSRVDQWFSELGASVLDKFMSIDSFARCAPIAEIAGICYCRGTIFVQYGNDCLYQVIPHTVRILIGTRAEPHRVVPLWSLIPHSCTSLRDATEWRFENQQELDRCVRWLVESVLPEFGRKYWQDERLLRKAIIRFESVAMDG